MVKTLVNLFKASFYIEFLRACYIEGLKNTNGKNRFLTTLHGVFSFIKDQESRAEIKRNVHISLTYSNGSKFEKFLDTEKSYQTKAIARLIGNSYPDKRKYKVLDIGCHYGYLIDDIGSWTNIDIEEYTGIDLGIDTIKQAKKKIYQRNLPIDPESCKFIAGNALDPTLYESLPNDNHLIVCVGLSHITVKEVEILFSNLNKVLAENKDARIYFSSTVFEEHNEHEINRQSLLKFFTEMSRIYDTSLNEVEHFVKTATDEEVGYAINNIKQEILSKSVLEGKGIEKGFDYKVYRHRDYEFIFNAKDRCQLEKLMDQCGFKIDKEKSYISSVIMELTVDYYCLKRKD